MVIPCFGSTSQCGDSRSPASARMNRKWPVFLAISALRLNAQVTATTPRDLAEPGYRVRATIEHIQLDARFSELVWASTDSIVDFRQREPVEGAPATERTVVSPVPGNIPTPDNNWRGGSQVSWTNLAYTALVGQFSSTLDREERAMIDHFLEDFADSLT